MHFMETVCCENHAKHTNILSRKNAYIQRVQASGIYSNHLVLIS